MFHVKPPEKNMKKIGVTATRITAIGIMAVIIMAAISGCSGNETLNQTISEKEKAKHSTGKKEHQIDKGTIKTDQTQKRSGKEKSKRKKRMQYSSAARIGQTISTMQSIIGYASK